MTFGTVLLPIPWSNKEKTQEFFENFQAGLRTYYRCLQNAELSGTESRIALDSQNRGPGLARNSAARSKKSDSVSTGVWCVPGLVRVLKSPSNPQNCRKKEKNPGKDPPKISVSRNKGGRKQMLSKRKQTQTNAGKRKQTQRRKRKQGQANASKRISDKRKFSRNA